MILPETRLARLYVLRHLCLGPILSEMDIIRQAKPEFELDSHAQWLSLNS